MKPSANLAELSFRTHVRNLFFFLIAQAKALWSISSRPFEELGYFDETKKDTKDDVRDDGSSKDNSENSGEEEK